MNGNGYSALPYFRRRFDAVARRSAFSAGSADQCKAWQRTLRRKLKQLTGYETMQPTDPQPRITEQIELDDCFRQHVEIRTEPGVVMTLYVLVPKTGSAPWPAVIATHGHASGGKAAVAGDRTHPEVARTIDEHNYDYGRQFVRQGLIVFCPDARGFGERQEPAVANEGVLASSCRHLNSMAYPLGQTVTGMWTWDLHRLVDYIRTRPDCRGTRIGCAGLSGGGLQTLWAAALDPRIGCAVVSGYFYGYKQSLLDMYQCSCNYVPHLYEYVDMGDIAALIAPRPLLIETGDSDPLNGAGGLRNVQPQVAIARKAYRLLAAQRQLKHHVFPGPHRWCGQQALPWMKEHLA